MEVLRDSVETSVHLKLFKTLEEASYAHIFKSKLQEISMEKVHNFENFNSARFRLQPYPADDSPRKGNDTKSIAFTVRKILNDDYVDPIWLYKKGSKYTLLDGAHRLVAHYKQNMKTIQAYVIS
jgi:hypothetical protein